MLKEKLAQYFYDLIILSSSVATLFINETKEVLALSTSFVVLITACYRLYKEVKNKNKK